jgi:hypothetical protein
MTPVISQVAAIVAGVALLTTALIIFPRGGMKGLAKGVGVSVSLAIVAAVLITAARSFGPY